MKIGIIGAMDIETKKLKDKLKNVTVSNASGMNFFSGMIDDKEVIICNCFEGKVNAAVGTQILISNFNVDCIINIGVAGGLSKDINICDLVIASSCVEFDLDTTALGYDLGYVFGLEKINMLSNKDMSNLLYEISCKHGNSKLGIVATSDKFISDKDTKNILVEKFNAIAVDMETASICHVCNLNNIPFSAIRAISDTCSNMEYKEFLKIALDKLDLIVYDFIKLIDNI